MRAEPEGKLMKLIRNTRVVDLRDGGIRGGISPPWQRTKRGQENDLGVCGWEKEKTALKRTDEELGSSGSIPEGV